jgi:hypothetical protein
MIERNFVTRETLAAIEDVNRRCHELHVPAPPVVFVTTELFERGVPVLRQHEQARSWTRNFYNLLAGTLLPAPSDTDPLSVGYGPGSLKIKASDGRVTNYVANYGVHTGAEIAGIVTRISIGTGTSASSIEDYCLESPVEDGTGPGQMTGDEGVYVSITYNTETKKWTAVFYKDFNNNSGGTITIGETGLIRRLSANVTTNNFVERNVLASPVAVADGQILRVTYTTEMTFPA